MATIAKVTARGAAWTSFLIGYGISAYKMEAYGSTKAHYETIDHIVVQPRNGKRDNGWEVLLYGDSVQLAPDKRTAQREAERLLDNPRSPSGWLVQNTGRSYYDGSQCRA